MADAWNVVLCVKLLRARIRLLLTRRRGGEAWRGLLAAECDVVASIHVGWVLRERERERERERVEVSGSQERANSLPTLHVIYL